MSDGRFRRYLARIGVEGAVHPTGAELRRLHRAHLQTVPFENIDVRRGTPIVLDEAAFVRKIVDDRRGGFCYELNAAFAWLLRAAGFEVALWSAHVRGDAGWGIDFDHMLLHVALQEPWIADVGFGDGFLDPLRLVAGEEQVQGARRYRMTWSAPYWCFEEWSAEHACFEARYRFEPLDRALGDFAPGVEHHQRISHFTERTVVSMFTPTGRKTLRDDRLILTVGDGRTERPIASVAEWRALLSAQFGVQLPDPSFSP